MIKDMVKRRTKILEMWKHAFDEMCEWGISADIAKLYADFVQAVEELAD